MLLNKGKADGPGSQWVFLSALLMLSLCLEAYLNFAGPIVFGPAWMQGKSPYADQDTAAKLALIAAACGVNLEARRKYWTVVHNLLELRQSMSQARQRRLIRKPPATAHPPSARPARPIEPAWSPYCHADVVLDYALQLRRLCESLHAALPRQGQGRTWLSFSSSEP